MERIVIRYRLQAGEAERNLELVRAVYAELEATGPQDFRFVTYALEDGVSFVDVAEATELPGPLPQLASFRRYRDGMEERCDERVASMATVVAAYPG